MKPKKMRNKAGETKRNQVRLRQFRFHEPLKTVLIKTKHVGSEPFSHVVSFRLETLMSMKAPLQEDYAHERQRILFFSSNYPNWIALTYIDLHVGLISYKYFRK
jgi:hypothetical protein